MEQREIPVYVLHRLPDAPVWRASIDTSNTYSFSGQGFNGKGIPLKPFADYIANELPLPVVDETGLASRYNINQNQ